MVAITVILAAVIAAFVMDIGPGGADPTAGVSFNEDGGEVSVTWQSQGQNNGTLMVHCDGDVSSSENFTLDQVGDSDTCTSPSDRVVVMSQRSGQEGVIDEYDV